MTHVLPVAQALGVLAVLVGVALALPLYGALVADGVLVVALATVVELILQRRPAAPSDGRSATNAPGGE